MSIFPSQIWLESLIDKLNTDTRYAEVAKKWEGDMLFVIEPDGVVPQMLRIYIDLWHGKCRQAYFLEQNQQQNASFTLKAPYNNFVKVLMGEIEPMRAMLTRKLGVQGDMAIMMRNIPTVLDFVRCCREITTGKL